MLLIGKKVQKYEAVWIFTYCLKIFYVFDIYLMFNNYLSRWDIIL